ncbi:extracellular solute-binding protein [Vulcanococcus limneticus]|uniref:extracellular solute-binding protein n=1 Tax=Vulcanococcus limneticus TaxID=2170428 RepID=UPI00398BF0CD
MEVSVLMPAPFADATAPLVAAFNRGHRDLQIAVTRGPLDTEALSDLAISSLLLGDTPYDLLLMDVTWTPKYAAAGWLEPLERLLGEDAMEGMAAGAQLGNAFGGHLWRLPLLADMGLFYWRTDLMDAPPRSLQELAATAADLKAKGKVSWGYVWQGRQYEGLSCVFLEVLRAFGGAWLQASPGGRDQAALDSPAAIAAARWLGDLVRQGVTPAAVANVSESESLQIFGAGEAAFMRNWPYAWAELQKPGSAVAGRVGVVSLGDGTQGSWGFSMLRGSAHPQQAAAVMRWFTSEPTSRDLAERFGYTPVWQSLLDDPQLQQRLPLLPVLRQALERTALRPLTPVYAQLSDVLQRQLSGLITGSGTAETAMAEAQRQSTLILQSAGPAA